MFSREMVALGLSVMNVSSATSGLPHRHLEGIPFFPASQSLRVIAGLRTKPYVTVHHGFDLKFLPVKTRESDYKSTKNISLEQWRQIVSLLRRSVANSFFPPWENRQAWTRAGRSLAFEESEMPSRPVFSCSLRKNGPRPESVPLPFTPRGFGKKG